MLQKLILERNIGKTGGTMWFSAIKLAISAGSKIYANKQKAKLLIQEFKNVVKRN